MAMTETLRSVPTEDEFTEIKEKYDEWMLELGGRKVESWRLPILRSLALSPVEFAKMVSDKVLYPDPRVSTNLNKQREQSLPIIIEEAEKELHGISGVLPWWAIRDHIWLGQLIGVLKQLKQTHRLE